MQNRTFHQGISQVNSAKHSIHDRGDIAVDVYILNTEARTFDPSAFSLPRAVSEFMLTCNSVASFDYRCHLLGSAGALSRLWTHTVVLQRNLLLATVIVQLCTGPRWDVVLCRNGCSARQSIPSCNDGHQVQVFFCGTIFDLQVKGHRKQRKQRKQKKQTVITGVVQMRTR
jgi:hypothetical protein